MAARVSEVRFWLVALCICVSAVALRFSALDRQGLWDDEVFTLQGVGVIHSPMTMVESQPPLYFNLLKGWMRLSGKGVSAIRAFSALWGVVGVVVIGFAAGRMFSARAGLFAAALLAFHPFHLAYSQEARAYSMVFALSAAALWAAWEKRTTWTVVLTALVLWTHPWGIFVWMLSAVVLRRWQSVIALILGLPALWYMAHLGLASQNFWAQAPNLAAVGRVVELMTGGAFHVGGWRFNAGVVRVPLVALVAWLWIAGLAQEDEKKTRLTCALGLIALVLLPLLGGIIEPSLTGHSRYFIVALPVALLLAVRGWAQLQPRWQAVAAVGVMTCFAFTTWQYFTVWQKGNVREAAAYVSTVIVPGDTLIVPGYMRPLWNVYDRTGQNIVDEATLDVSALPDTSGIVFVTLDVPNDVRDAMDRRFHIETRRTFHADYSLGLVVTRYR